jgi:hypothetical protein
MTPLAALHRAGQRTKPAPAPEVPERESVGATTPPPSAPAIPRAADPTAIAEAIVRAGAKARGELTDAFERGPAQPTFRKVTAAEIIAAAAKARGEGGDPPPG